MELEVVRDQVAVAVQEAGVAVLELRETFLQTGRIGVDTKDDRSPVSEADRAAHQVLADLLPQILDVPVVSEEGSHDVPADGAYWLVDPLDGTKEFLKGRDEWTVNVALVQDGKPILGVVAAPVLAETWSGIPGHGAWKEEDGWQPIHSAPAPAGAPVRAVVSLSHRGEAVDGFLAALRDAGHEVQELSYGSSLKLCRVAEGAAEVYPRLGPTMHWDTAAAHAVVAGAGGTVRSVEGDELRYGEGDLRNPWFVCACPGEDWLQYLAVADA